MSKAELHQRVLRYYRDEHGDGPVQSRDVAEWGVKNGLLPRPRPVDPMAKLAEEMSKAFREETRRDPLTGFPYRANHAVTETTRDGKQQTFWGDIDTAPRKFVQKAFTQRRNQIVGECMQLTLDVDHFNSSHRDEEPILMVLDFTDDVEEGKIAMAGELERVAAPH